MIKAFHSLSPSLHPFRTRVALREEAAGGLCADKRKCWWLRHHCHTGNRADGRDWPQDHLTSVVQTLLQQMQDKFQTMSEQIIGRIDDMSSRIDDLERNIADLMTQARVEDLEGENKILATQKKWRLLIYTEIWNIVFTSQEKTKWLCATNYFAETSFIL